MTSTDWQTEEFERHRRHLRAVAYRILGSVSDADDVVQEAWLRLNRSDTESVENMRAWLTTVVARLSLDQLRARQARREDYVGEWLPEPVVMKTNGYDPEEEALLADSVGLALLVVLEQLTPGERLAFVLHDMFALPFDEIAPIVGRTPAATRQLASRARRRVSGSRRTPDVDLEEQRAVVDAFLAASRAGDFDALLELLDPDVVFRLDGGGVRAGKGPMVVSGSIPLAQRILETGPTFSPYCKPAVVNGAAGLVVEVGERRIGVIGMTIVDGLIVEIDVVADPEKVAATVG
jgi:RNA polymerase sigma-70 factor (ECF subfamily)